MSKDTKNNRTMDGYPLQDYPKITCDFGWTLGVICCGEGSAYEEIEMIEIGILISTTTVTWLLLIKVLVNQAKVGTEITVLQAEAIDYEKRLRMLEVK